jgi:hypothetical protein
MIYAQNSNGDLVVTSRKRARRFGLRELAGYNESRELAEKINTELGERVVINSAFVPRRLLREYWREVKQIKGSEVDK